MQELITLTADDATMNVIIWIHVFPSWKALLEAFKFIYILRII